MIGKLAVKELAKSTFKNSRTMKRNDGTARYESKKAMLKKRREGLWSGLLLCSQCSSEKKLVDEEKSRKQIIWKGEIVHDGKEHRKI